MHDMLKQELERLRIAVSPFENTWNLTRGEGPMAHRTNLDPGLLPAAQNAQLAAGAVHGFARGVAAVMAEPARSTAAQWDFRRTAARVTANLETEAFLAGAQAANGGEPVFFVPFVDDLFLVIYVQLDNGSRVLTRRQVDAWEATNDRVISAARSLLFHHSANVKWGGTPPVLELDGRDDQNAVRTIVFEDLYYSDFKPTIRFGIPTQQNFMFVFGDNSDDIETLKRAVHDTHAAAAYPLSPRVYAFMGGQPVPMDH